MDSFDLSEKIMKVIEDRLWEHMRVTIPCRCPNNGEGDCEYCEAWDNIRAEVEEIIETEVQKTIDRIRSVF